MSSSDLIRWGGLAAMLSGGMFIVLFLLGLVSTDGNIPSRQPGE
jgi:hypothetical protein